MALRCLWFVRIQREIDDAMNSDKLLFWTNIERRFIDYILGERLNIKLHLKKKIDCVKKLKNYDNEVKKSKHRSS